MKKINKVLLLGASLFSVFVFNQGPVSGTYINPYQYPKTINTAVVNEADYMDQKTKTMFIGSKKPEAPYVAPKGWTQDLDSMKSVRLEKYTPDQKGTDRVLLFLHGGGYIAGNSTNQRDWAIAQGHALGQGDVYMLDYRYSPEALYPTALDEAAAAYKAILAAGVPADKIVLAGDSAGGNLAAALSLYCRDHNLPMPGLLVLYSPWEDAGDLPTHEMNAERDVVLGKRNPSMFTAVTNNNDYFRNADLKAPYVSPVYADLKGLPPTLIIGGGHEMFLDDILLFAGHARSAGVDVETHIFPGLSHDWPLIFPEIPEAADAYALLSSFADQHMAK